MINITLDIDSSKQCLSAEENKNLQLPVLEKKGEAFLGWTQYDVQQYNVMNVLSATDITLKPRFTSGAAYILKSHFRGVKGDAKSSRCQYRRYVIDIYLQNVVAKSGCLKLENINNILYYFASLPIDKVTAEVKANTNQRGGAYNGAAYFTTSDIEISWKSDQPLDAVNEPKKVATILLCFGRWGMSYGEIERRTSDDIIMAAPDFNATADDKTALVSANFYGGVIMEDEISSDNPAMITVKDDADLKDIDFGSPITRFAVLSDSHIGKRYGWKDYNWLYGVFDHLKELHTATPLDFVLQLGDNIDDGYAVSYKNDYDEYLEIIKGLEICDPLNPITDREKDKVPHYELQGNHDTSLDTRFFRQKLWYAERDGKKVAFIAFFTKYGGYPAVKNLGVSYKSYGILSDETVDFVADSVNAAKKAGAEHIILCNHFGIAQDLEAPILPESGLGRLESICNKNKIRLYLNGHEHNADYTLRKYGNIYNYDAAMTRDKYAVFEIFKRYAKITVYNSQDNNVERIDVIDLEK